MSTKQDGLKLNGTYQSLACADDVILLREKINATQKRGEAILVAVKRGWH